MISAQQERRGRERRRDQLVALRLNRLVNVGQSLAMLVAVGMMAGVCHADRHAPREVALAGEVPAHDGVYLQIACSSPISWQSFQSDGFTSCQPKHWDGASIGAPLGVNF